MCDIKFRVWNRQSKEYITGNRARVDGDGLLYIDRITVKNCFRPPHTRKKPLVYRRAIHRAKRQE